MYMYMDMYYSQILILRFLSKNLLPTLYYFNQRGYVSVPLMWFGIVDSTLLSVQHYRGQGHYLEYMHVQQV